MKKEYKDKVLCKKCGKYYHPKEYEVCYKCYSEQPARIKQYGVADH